MALSAVLRGGEPAEYLRRVQRTLLLYAAGASEALPMMTAALARRPVRGARAWIVGWTVSQLAFDQVALYLGLHHQRNVWVGYVSTPVETALLLWAFSCWQTGEIGRLAMRLALAATLAVWAVLTVAVENTSTFSRAAEPMLNLVCIGAAAATLLVRSHAARTSLLDQDWFWISAGVALFFAPWSALGPLSLLLLGGSPSLFSNAYEITAALGIVGMLVIARGMACPVES